MLNVFPILSANTNKRTNVNSFLIIPYIKNTPVIEGKPNQKTVIGDNIRLIGSKTLRIRTISKDIPNIMMIGSALNINSLLLNQVCLRITL